MQLTKQGTIKIQVYFVDKYNKNNIWCKHVIRAFLARMYHEQRVVGAIKGIPVVEV